MDAEQIKKALECCASEKCLCNQCPIDEKIKDDCECGKVVARNAISLINELTEENERLRVDNEILKMPRATIFEIADAFDRGHKKGKADTVRKMQEELKKTFSALCKGEMGDLYRIIDQIAKEMLEGEK